MRLLSFHINSDGIGGFTLECSVLECHRKPIFDHIRSIVTSMLKRKETGQIVIVGMHDSNTI